MQLAAQKRCFLTVRAHLQRPRTDHFFAFGVGEPTVGKRDNTDDDKITPMIPAVFI